LHSVLFASDKKLRRIIVGRGLAPAVGASIARPHRTAAKTGDQWSPLQESFKRSHKTEREFQRGKRIKNAFAFFVGWSQAVNFENLLRHAFFCELFFAWAKKSGKNLS